eukprot:scaffold169869_cov84-Attheya_sp.AAC.1
MSRTQEDTATLLKDVHLLADDRGAVIGKTTFIEYLVGKKFPGARVGPEPTTDKFYAIMADLGGSTLIQLGLHVSGSVWIVSSRGARIDRRAPTGH